jgi:GDP-4-dehydro-6-deoxy-D-mannose reductase
MKTLVTGLDGFAGTHLQSQMECLPLDFNSKSVNLLDVKSLRQAVGSIMPDAVIHLAAQSSVPASFENPEQTIATNFTGTLNLLTALREIRFKGRFIFVGSGDTYGLVAEHDLPIVEQHPLRPRSPYAVSKVAAEALCYQWSQTADFNIIMTRPFNHIGPGQDTNFVVSDFAKQLALIKLGRQPAILNVGDIDVTRDFTDVRDVVAAYVLLLRHGRNGEVYNVCSGVERSIRSILAELLSISGVAVRVESDPAKLRVIEQRRICGDSTRLQKDTGWRPMINLSETLSGVLTYWENKLR